MFKKFSKISILVLLMASTVCFTSCDETDDEDDPNPNGSSSKKGIKLSKSKVERILNNHRWEVSNTKGTGMMSGKSISGLEFKSGRVDVYYGKSDRPFDLSTVEKVDYAISTDGKKLKIDNTKYTFLRLSDAEMIIKSRDTEYTLEEETRF